MCVLRSPMLMPIAAERMHASQNDPRSEQVRGAEDGERADQPAGLARHQTPDDSGSARDRGTQVAYSSGQSVMGGHAAPSPSNSDGTLR